MNITDTELSNAIHAWQNADQYGKRVLEDILGAKVFYSTANKLNNNEMLEPS